MAIKINWGGSPTWTEKKNRFIEVNLLMKTSDNGYWDNPVANLRLITTFWLAIRVYFLVFGLVAFIISLAPEVFIKKEVDVLSLVNTSVFSFFAFWFGMFWREKAHIHNKWAYLAGLYNEIIKTEPSVRGKGYDKRMVMEIALALDILKLEMWGHSSYREIFQSILIDGIKYTTMPVSATPVRLSIADESGFGISKAEAEAILIKYQHGVLRNEIDFRWFDHHLKVWQHMG